MLRGLVKVLGGGLGMSPSVPGLKLSDIHNPKLQELERFRGLGFRGLGFRGLGFKGSGFRGLRFGGLVCHRCRRLSGNLAGTYTSISHT